MAGGKETPRQKMIGMMYLVLTALLALQVNSAILLKFKFIDDSLLGVNDKTAVAADGTVRKQIVKTGIQDINNIAVLSGLKEGDVVVTGPYDVVSKTLKDGDKVKVVPKSSLFDVKK